MVESGVTVTSGAMIIDTNQLGRNDIYTIYLEHADGVQSKSYTFTLKDL
jgi:hypothetical protein